MILGEAYATLEGYADVVQNELRAAQDGRSLESSFAARVFRMVRGEDPELAGELALVKAALLEWDIAPDRAQALLDAWLQDRFPHLT
jgi:hypothetical protein